MPSAPGPASWPTTAPRTRGPCRTSSTRLRPSPTRSARTSSSASGRSSSGCRPRTTARRSTGSARSSGELGRCLTPGQMRVVELAGGVGGAKLAHGLQAILGDRLTVVVNTGDDLERHGLLVCPDHDTVMYTLAGIDNREWGWGIAGETFAASEMLARYGEETWFRLGDRDLATHVVRTRRLRDGERLTSIALGLQASLGVRARILPMADEPVRTQVRTAEGWLDFQTYFVGRHQEPEVHEIRFGGVGGGPGDARGPCRARRCGRHRGRTVESVRLRGADPGGAGDPARDRCGPGPGRPRRGDLRDRRREGDQGAGGPDARLARRRGERARCRQAVCRLGGPVRAGHGRRAAGAGDPRPRVRNPGRRHDDGGRRGAGATRE